MNILILNGLFYLNQYLIYFNFILPNNFNYVYCDFMSYSNYLNQWNVLKFNTFNIMIQLE